MFGTHYVSEEGLEKLKEELVHRERVLRREIAEKIGNAKDQGDISENFEYQESKEQQAINETRIIYLRDFISRAVITEKDEKDQSIQVGSTFSVKTGTGDEKTFSMVGFSEADPMAGKISNDSPIGKLFFGKKEGDTVELTMPTSTMTYTILKLL
jgi:transcription elongation factor GreA